MLGKKLIVEKAFNNNVVLCFDQKEKRECVFVGKGIGFGMKPGEKFKQSDRIDKKFYMMDESNQSKFHALTKEIDEKIVGVTEEIIAMIASEIQGELNEKIHVTLLDHIAFAIMRMESHIEIHNPFLHEVQSLYQEEFILAKKAIACINQSLSIVLPIDETAFIAMHINAAIHSEDVYQVTRNTNIISHTVQMIEDALGREMDKESIEYGRMITHLRFAIDRTQKQISIDNLLLDNIKEKYYNSYVFSKQIADRVAEEYDLVFPDGEIGYIAIHLENVFRSVNQR